MGIAGKNREGMQKYRRFAENLKGRCARSAAFTAEQCRIVPRGSWAEPQMGVWIGNRADGPSARAVNFRYVITGIFRRF